MHLEFVKPASAFLLIHSEEPVDGSILGPVSTAYADIYRRGAFESNTELVDELLHSPGRYEVKHCVVKLPSDHSPEKVGQAIKELRLTDRPNVQIRLLRAVEPALISLTDDEYERTQFRREGAVDSQFVSHVDSSP